MITGCVIVATAVLLGAAIGAAGTLALVFRLLFR